MTCQRNELWIINLILWLLGACTGIEAHGKDGSLWQKAQFEEQLARDAQRTEHEFVRTLTSSVCYVRS